MQGKYGFPGDDTVERAVVGGTGKFRMASGYYLLKVVSTPTPESAVELKEPALQLMQVIEADPDDSFIEQTIRDLTVRSLEEVASSAEVQRRFQPILQQHRETLAVIRRKASYADGVVQFLSRDDADGPVTYLRIPKWMDGAGADKNLFYTFTGRQILIDTRRRVN